MRTRWDERDRWKIPPYPKPSSSLEWYDAPGEVRREATVANPDKARAEQPFWAVGVQGARWWANEDGEPDLFWFATEQEAMSFVEVMIRMA